MKKKLFEEKIQTHVTDEEYSIIEYVAQYHPAIQQKKSLEEQMALLYNNFGMVLIKDMVHLANENKKLQIRIRDLQYEISMCANHIQRLEDGTFPVVLDTSG